LNSACISAVKDYMKVRPVDGVKDKNALFISRNNRRMSVKTIQSMVYKYLEKIGLNAQGYSCHKLRHTAATLMYQHGGVDVRVLKEVLGHENLGTTEIYTHLSSEQLKNASDSNPLSKIKKKNKVE
ncbi:MAG: tyrosine-type recombinase/integrase, partial [Ruminococcus sp.]|nr:tyrosine-type recombinase/integrase [Ruminococcus sp.]